MSNPPSNPVDFGSNEVYEQTLKNMQEMGLDAQNADPVVHGPEPPASLQEIWQTQANQYEFSSENKYFGEENLKSKAESFIEEMKIPEAVLALEAGLTADENDVEMWHLLGKLKQECDEDSKAVYCFNKALSKDSENLDILCDLAVSYINDSEIENCISTIKKWLKTNEKISDVIQNENLENITNEELYQTLLKVEEKHNGDTGLLTLLGVMCFISSQFSKAAGHFRKAVQIEPKSYSFWNKLGASFANGNQTEKAVVCYRLALKIRPNLARAWANLGIAYSNSSKHQEAIVPYLNGLSLNPSAVHIWEYLVIIFSSMGDFDKIALCHSKDLDSLKQTYNSISLDSLPKPSFEGIDEALEQIKE